MAALAVDIAAGVVTALNNAANEPAVGWAEAFTAVRQYVPVHSLEDLDTVQVTVVAASDDRTNSDRVTQQRDIEISIGIQKQYDAESEIDTLMLLAEQIAGVFGGGGVRSVAGAHHIGTKSFPIIDPDRARESKQFTALVVLTFRAFTTSNTLTS